MKDESRAKWPEDLRSEGVIDTINGQKSILSGTDAGKLRIIVDVRAYEIEYDVIDARFKQIEHLPAMVALLKEISEQSLFFENEDGYYETTEFHDTAKAILAEIGEIE